jgi:hypothetical protein
MHITFLLTEGKSCGMARLFSVGATRRVAPIDPLRKRLASLASVVYENGQMTA